MTSFPGYSTDVVADRIFRSLLRDFRAVHGQDFAHFAELALDAGVPQFRSYEWPKIGNVTPHRFKCWHQLRSLLKRHIFTSDVWTKEELEKITMEKFLVDQEFFAVHRVRTPRTHAVLQEARRIAKNILGKYDLDEAASYVQIGKRATLGGPLEQAFLDKKVGSPEMFTCPSAARQWFFRNYLATDPALRKLVRGLFRKAKRNKQTLPLAADYLNFVTVPKSWKILRGITPLSLIGLFKSYALGGLITERLRSSGHDLRRLQSKHRQLARRYSVSNKHATVDLRTASDSIMSQHLNAVLPRVWYREIRTTFIRQLAIGKNGTMHYTCSVLPMGNGCTFPVETLFFYCLIKAIGNLLGVKGTYSVYGDDLIYPSRIHNYVRVVFSELGIRINEEKTFVDSAFRESCGGDFYRGVDVRPALLPETECHMLKGKKYAQYLYKVANALRARWSDEEIPATLHWLKKELSVTQRKIYQVPQHFPSTSGWKVTKPMWDPEWQYAFEVPQASFIRGDIVVRFRYLGETTPKLRPIENEEVYYWDCLRSMSTRQPPEWRWWKSWIVGLPQRQIGQDHHSYFKWIRYKTNKSDAPLIPGEPTKERAGSRVVDEAVSLDYWTQET